jgi:hypothetical protein
MLHIAFFSQDLAEQEEKNNTTNFSHVFFKNDAAKHPKFFVALLFMIMLVVYVTTAHINFRFSLQQHAHSFYRCGLSRL